MKGAQLRIQLSEETVGRLDGIAGRLGGESRAFAALRLIEEGLRTEKHPLVYFTDGPAVRRARLLGGPDVWEVISVVHGNNDDLQETAAYLEIPLNLVQAAAAYYEASQQEIDDWIERNRRETEDARLAAREASA